MDPELASRLVAELARLSAVDIAAEKMGAAELAAVGLEPPRTTVRILGRTPEAGGEAPELAKLSFGVEKGDSIFAQVPGRETVYRVSSKLAEHVPISLEAFRNRFVAKQAPAAENAPGAAPPPMLEMDGEFAAPTPADTGEVEDEEP
jgi:hypothetical protein